MQTAAGTDRTAVAARTESGRLCQVTVERNLLGDHVLRYDGSETAAAVLSPEVVELLTTALSVLGRSVITARCPSGAACTLLLIAQSQRVGLYFHAATTFCAALDRAAANRLRDALERLANR